jgi:hypothetical protein
VRNAVDENAKAARELSEVKSLDEMMALQTRLMGSQLERAADMWSRLWKTASESQVAMIGQVQNQVGQISDTVRQSYTRATEDAARSVASHTGNAANAAREVERKAHQERKSA